LHQFEIIFADELALFGALLACRASLAYHGTQPQQAAHEYGHERGHRDSSSILIGLVSLRCTFLSPGIT
jgi:hypothetical protein